MTGYAIPVSNGTYTVRLHFAETSSVTAAGQRVFNVLLENTTVLSNFDIFAEVGANAALIKTFTTTVSDGTLNIGFTVGVASPEINGIEVLSSGGSGTPTASNTPTVTPIPPTSNPTPTPLIDTIAPVVNSTSPANNASVAGTQRLGR